MPRKQKGRGTGATTPRQADKDAPEDPDFEEEEEEEEETTHSQDQGEPAAPTGAELMSLLTEVVKPISDRLDALEKKLERPAEEVGANGGSP